MTIYDNYVKQLVHAVLDNLEATDENRYIKLVSVEDLSAPKYLYDMSTFLLTFYIPPGLYPIELFQEHFVLPFPHRYISISISSAHVIGAEISYTLTQEKSFLNHETYLGCFLPNASGRRLCSGHSYYLQSGVNSINYEEPVTQNVKEAAILGVDDCIAAYIGSNYNADWCQYGVGSIGFRLILKKLYPKIKDKLTNKRFIDYAQKCYRSNRSNLKSIGFNIEFDFNYIVSPRNGTTTMMAPKFGVYDDMMLVYKELQNTPDFWNKVSTRNPNLSQNYMSNYSQLSDRAGAKSEDFLIEHNSLSVIRKAREKFILPVQQQSMAGV